MDSAAVHSLTRVFRQTFVVHDIAEPLISFDDRTPAETIVDFMDSRQLKVVGIRKDGLVFGHVCRTDLERVGSVDVTRMEDRQIVPDSLPLQELILRLRDRSHVFVSVFGTVGGIVTRSDLQKPPVRMWLFGIVTLIEMRLNQLIAGHCSEDEWPQYLSDRRLEKARELLQERNRRNQELELLSCLQLSDKAQIVARNSRLRDMTRFDSRNQFEKAAKMIERLRNNLAHSQDIIANDWDAIVALAENVNQVLDGPPGLGKRG